MTNDTITEIGITKKFATILFLITFFFSFSSIANADVTMSIGTATSTNGNTIDIPVSISNLSSSASTTMLSAVDITIQYDPSTMTYSTTTIGPANASQFAGVSITPGASSISFSWIDPATGDFSLSNLLSSNGVLFTLHFVVSTSQATTSNISFIGTKELSDATDPPGPDVISNAVFNDGSAVLNPVVTSVPSAPTSFATSSLTGTSVNFSWAPPSSNGGSVITGYYFQKYDVTANATTSTLYASTTLATSTTGLISGRVYRYSLSAVNAIGTSSPTVLTQTMPVVPNAPSSFATSSPVVYNSASFTWVAPSNGGSAITGYYFEVVTGGSTTTRALLSSATLATTTTGLSGSTAYTFYVSAVNVVGTSTLASVALTTPGAPTAPTAPTSFATTSVGYTNIDLSWAAPASTGGTAITNYYFQRYDTTTGTTSNLLSSATFSTSTTGLIGGRGYRFTLSALNAVGTGTPVVLYATTTTPTAPTAPNSFATTTVGGTSVALSWLAPSSSNGSAITGYYFQVFDGSATSSTLFSNATFSTTTTGLINGTAYRFTLSAVNGVGTSTVVILNQTTLSTPNAPTSFATTSVGYTNIDLSWVAPSSNGGSAITNYYLQIFNGSATTSSMLASGATTYSTTTLTGATAYRFTLSALNAVGTGTPVVLNVTTTAPSAPSVPNSFATSSLTGTSVAFSWLASTFTNGSAITGYYFQRYDATTGTTSNLLSNSTFATTSTGLVNGRAYRFTLSAVNSLGTSTSVIINQTMPSVPGTPTSLATSSMTYSTAPLTWTAPASNGAAITDYYIQYSTGGATSTWYHTPSSTNSATVTGLSGSTAYIFAVSAVNVAGTGTPAYVIGTTPATPPTVSISASPTSVTTGGASTISWTSTYASTCTTTMAGVDWQYATSSGGISSGALTSATTFSIACTGLGGSATDSTTVSVYSPGGSSSGGGGGGYRTPLKPVIATSTIALFTKNLSLGITDPDVKRLQQFLNLKGFTISMTGIGSKGSESTYFGSKTQLALANFQRANKITPASGLFGDITRIFVNGLIQSTGIIAPVISTSTPNLSFTRSLTLGSTGSDVRALQIYLNSHSFIVSTTGVGSPGNETTYFGTATQKALIKYQKAKGISPAVGFFGPVTQAFIKSNQ